MPFLFWLVDAAFISSSSLTASELIVLGGVIQWRAADIVALIDVSAGLVEDRDDLQIAGRRGNVHPGGAAVFVGLVRAVPVRGSVRIFATSFCCAARGMFL